MMEEVRVKASWEGVPYRVALSGSGHEGLSDVPKAMGGGDTAPNPHDLLLSALGACTAITIAMYARRKGWPLEGIDVDVQILEEKLSPPVKVRMSRVIELTGALDDEQRERLLEIANLCPVHKILEGEVLVESSLGG